MTTKTKKKTNKAKSAQETIVFNGKQQDKIERYKWGPIRDKPGKFMLLPKNVVNIDHSYQRPGNNEKAQEIAADFSWLAFGVALVSQREDGSFWAFDGQHRLMAACKRSDISMVPCMVYKIDRLQDEAGGFLDGNDKRKPLAYVYKHNAKLITGDETAHMVNNLLAANKYEAIKGRKEGRYIACLALLARNLKADRAAMERVFPVVVDAARGGFILERLLDGFFYLERYGNQSLTEKRWRDRIKKVAPAEYEQAINLAAAAYAKGGPKRFAEGIANILNKGMRSKIEIGAPVGRE